MEYGADQGQTSRHRRFQDVFVGGIAVVAVVGSVVTGRILLGLLSAVMLVTLYVPIRRDQLRELVPIGLGWLVATYGVLAGSDSVMLVAIASVIVLYLFRRRIWPA